jgi:predicted transcriptional regulator YdeE/DNA-binding transcriptional MerR regulator
MLTIGQMARICNVSTKTLHHYEAIGLFLPAQIGKENQYRYYMPQQIELLRKIVFFRSLGLGLEVIRELHECGAMAHTNRVNAILQEHIQTIRDEITSRQQLLAQVESKMREFETKGEKTMIVKVITVEQFSVVGMEHNSKTSSESFSQTWVRFLPREGEIQEKINPSVSYGVWISTKEGGFDYVAGVESDYEPLPKGMVRVSIPTQKYAIFTRKGALNTPGHTVADTFMEIHQTWLQHYQYTPVQGIDFVRYDERFFGTDNDQSEIDIYIPIE